MPQNSPFFTILPSWVVCSYSASMIFSNGCSRWLFDAIGLGLFAVTGTQKALNYGITWRMAAILGMISGIGGGMMRDVLTAQVPSVLCSDFYAVAALAGALVVVAGDAARLPLPLAVVGWAGVGICVFLRLMALYRGWRLPVAPSKGR